MVVDSGILDGLRVLGFDLETTGFNPREDRVVQYALVGSDSDGSHVNLNSLVDPGRGIPSEASEVHGIWNDDVRGAGGFEQHVETLGDMIDGSVIVGHNVVAFDWRFIEMECMRIGRETPRPLAIVDTLILARRFEVPGRRCACAADSGQTRAVVVVECLEVGAGNRRSIFAEAEGVAQYFARVDHLLDLAVAGDIIVDKPQALFGSVERLQTGG